MINVLNLGASDDGPERHGSRVGRGDVRRAHRLLDVPQDADAAAVPGQLRRVRAAPHAAQPRHDVRAPGLGPAQRVLLQVRRGRHHRYPTPVLEFDRC